MHNHIIKLILMQARGEIPTNPGLHDLRIEHDDWCALLNYGGECNCDPTFSLTENVSVDTMLKNQEASAKAVQKFRRAKRQ